MQGQVTFGQTLTICNYLMFAINYNCEIELLLEHAHIERYLMHDVLR